MFRDSSSSVPTHSGDRQCSETQSVTIKQICGLLRLDEFSETAAGRGLSTSPGFTSRNYPLCDTMHATVMRRNAPHALKRASSALMKLRQNLIDAPESRMSANSN